MTMSRRTVVDERTTGVYHCISRCVRRAFLCGIDEYSGKDYEHRKDWVRDRLRELCSIFGIELFAYAVMSNHLHLVMRTLPELVQSWTPEEVANRWMRLFPVERDETGNPLVPESMRIEAFCQDTERVKTCRDRLGNLSWFMRCLNESIARRANREDECTGRFWEGRFKCQRLMDEGAILACMAYVDLNPVRAGLAETPETSEFTSVYDRIVAQKARNVLNTVDLPENPTLQQQETIQSAHVLQNEDNWLRGFGENGSQSVFHEIDLAKYLELLDWTGRSVKAGKQGRLPEHLAPIMQRLQLDTENWTENVKRYGSLYYRIAGKAEQLINVAIKTGQKWFKRKKPDIDLFVTQMVRIE